MQAKYIKSGKYKSEFRLLIYAAAAVIIIFYIYLCEIGWGFSCFFYEQFNILCPSCGATGAALAILSGDISAAVASNPIFALAFYPIGGILFLQDFFICIYRVLKKSDKIPYSMLEYLFAKQERS